MCFVVDVGFLFVVVGVEELVMSYLIVVYVDDVILDGELLVGVYFVICCYGYLYYGIYVGDGNVIYYVGWLCYLSGGVVEVVIFDGFCVGFEFVVICYVCVLYDGIEVVCCVVLCFGECCYWFFMNNCEYFCLWCLFGVGCSD